MFRISRTILAALVLFAGFAPVATARTPLRNICRVKGQEENVLRGLGLVVGLAGTGEAGDPVTMRALSRAMELMGSPVPEVSLGAPAGRSDLEKWKNTCLVLVTARVPATGARRGDKLDCHISAINGKSLAGGRLAFAALQGPNTQDPRVYALCEGAVELDDPAQPLVGKVHNGCQMEEDVMTPFVSENNQITLILDKNHANFYTANDVAEAIRSRYSREDPSMVLALNAANIVVTLPAEYVDDPVQFVADLLGDLTVYSPEPEARVVINERTGSIVISGNVTIGDVVISHRDVVVEAGAVQWDGLGTEEVDDAKLQSLVNALRALEVPADEMIDIIKGIDRNGKLHGVLIME
ncbi:MAG: flagellar basal body P-ring protein FlgI [Planctomycetales bacterium]|nr:flagellar basal body P-ring protein FlgI [Planctomycetales bacterium]